jgi:hypothetical protein
VIRKSVGVQSKRDFVLSFSHDTPDEVIMREAKDAGIGLSRAYLQSIRNPAPPRARRARPPEHGARPPRPGREPEPELGRPRSLIDRLREMLKDPP